MLGEYTGEGFVRVHNLDTDRRLVESDETCQLLSKLQPTSFVARSLMRLRSLAGSCMTSPFTLRSVASPVTGLLPAVAEGLSLALTHGASPWSGISRVTFPYMAAISWL